jgi:hypothetical protein
MSLHKLPSQLLIPFLLAAVLSVVLACAVLVPGEATLTAAPRLIPETGVPSASSPAAPEFQTAGYDIGNPVLTDVWVDPVNGDDAHSGTSRNQSLRTISEAWNRIPQDTTLTGSGYRLQLVAGDYPENNFPIYWESRYGTANFPIILRSADAPGSATLHGFVNVNDTHYLYLLDLTITNEGDVFHCEKCNHLLIRDSVMNGGSGHQAHETIKINQSQYIYIEGSNIFNTYENAIDFVAVQYGHITGNRLHDADDWCIYLKGGSAYFRVEGNEIYNCGTGGFSAGQGTGFNYMVSPWLHYEAYDIKFVNNIVHDTRGAGMGVNGGYNILLAYNTLYRVGENSHLIEVVFGVRGCDEAPGKCAAYLAAGGWGTTAVGGEGEPIPDRNVFIYNNIVYNPSGYQSQWQHFAIMGPRIPSAGSNIPSPAVTDRNLQIRGNLIWNGDPSMPLGIEDPSLGCQDSNLTCNAAQLRRDNTINKVQPQLVEPASGDFHPIAGGNVFGVTTFPIPDFGWGDAPSPPTVPAGDLNNHVIQDRDGLPRQWPGIPGAYAGGTQFSSRGAHDGWVLESSANSNTGGSFNSMSGIFRLGDDQGDRQYRAILSFSTGGLPDNALITSAVLKIRRKGLAGTDPFITHKPLLVDIRAPYIGTTASLAAADFQAAASNSNIATFSPTPSSGWYSAALQEEAFSSINLSGTTQFRLRFKLDDDDDHVADYVKFYSGNSTTSSYRPRLIIQYSVP